jgi:signal transduction histidine kinase
MSSSRTTPPKKVRDTVYCVRSRITTLFGRYVIDAAVCVLAVIILVEDLVSPTATLADIRYDRGPEIVIIPITVVVAALMLARRRMGIAAPLISLALFGASSFPARVWLPSSGAAYLLIIVVCGTLGYLTVSRAAFAGLALVELAPAIAVSRQPDRSWGNLTWVLVTLTLAWLAGLLLRRPFERARLAEERALLLERDRERSAQLAVAGERQRIARELHDVIAHSVSVMTVQAGAVRRLLTPEQEKEREALLSVEATGRQALTEMRRLVGLLKEDTVMPMYAPQPSMKTLDVLVGTVREAGLPVELTVEGERRELAPGVDLAAYRVVQEALTNALKYAGPARAWVSVNWAGDQLELQVENDGQVDNGEGGGGHGLVGMKERISVVGGTLESGPRPGGGFVVKARIPIGEAA